MANTGMSWQEQENCTIHAGYVSGSIERPWLMPCSKSRVEFCPLPGITIEILRQLAKYFNCKLNKLEKFEHFGSFMADENGRFGGILDVLGNGSINVIATKMDFTPDRIKHFKYSLPFTKYGLKFFRKAGEHDHAHNFSPFVFTYAVFLWFLILFSTQALLLWIIRIRLYSENVNFFAVLWGEFRKFEDVRKWHRKLYCYCLLFGFTVLYVSYYACFRSQALRTHFQTNLNIDDLKSELNQNGKVLILPSIDIMKTDQKLLVFGTENLENDSRVEFLEDRDLAFQKICASDKYLMFRTQNALTGTNMYPCQLRIYSLEMDPTNHVDAFRYRESSGTLYFYKDTPNRVIEKVNELILKLLAEDQLHSYWFPRYFVNSRKVEDQKKKVRIVPGPFQIHELEDGFLFWLIACSLTVCALFGENLTSVYRAKTRVRRV